MEPLPKIVFQHYREPRNQGPLPTANARGQVDGRREASKLTLHLQIDDGVVTAATFELHRDKSAAAGMSLLTTWLTGRPLAEVEALTVEALAAAYELHPEQLPMLVPPLEALEDALCDFHGKPSPFRDEGPLICHCLQVRRGRLVRQIERRGLRRLEDLRYWTRACTGCRSCRLELQDLLDEHAREGQRR